MNTYDVVIVGAGPAGIFAALNLCKTNTKVLLVDEGNSISKRIEDSLNNKSSLKGFGGSGGFSDGKIIFSSETGGRLSEIISDDNLENYLLQSKDIWKDFSKKIDTSDYSNISASNVVDKANNIGLRLVISDILHIGSDLLPLVLKKMEDYLIDNGIDMAMNCKVSKINIEDNKVKSIVLSNGDVIKSESVFIAPGRGGARWLMSEAQRIGLNTSDTPVDIGIRVEVPSHITKNMTDLLYEFKVKYLTPTYNDWVRTFCVCPNGYVAEEKHDGFKLVNGYSNNDKSSQNTNFALLSSIKLCKPISSPLEFSSNIAKTVNSVADGILVQRIGDLMSHRRSTIKSIAENSVIATLQTANPGDLNLSYPHRFITNLVEGLQAIDKLIDGLFSDDTLFYAPEIKMYSETIMTDSNLQSEIEGLYIGGDGAGVSRGIAQASISGLIFSDAILN